MQPTSINKILVALDGSDRSVRTAKYLAGLKGLAPAEVHLFHVFSGIPESHFDLAKEPSPIKISGQLLSWQHQQRRQMEKHMEKCRKILLAADFDPERVKIIIHDRKRGIARDIISTVSTAHTPYDVVFIRRRGMTKLTGLIMGSVAYKLLDGISMAPLVFAGRKPENGRILIGMDLSENASRAVDFVGRMTQGTGVTVCLAAVIRGPGYEVSESGAHGDIAAYEKALSEAFTRARKRLADFGFEAGAVTDRIIRNEPSRAGALVALAEAEEFNTIAVGRKGVSSLDEFLIGRVSRKILQVGRKHHVWIVN